MKIGFIGAGKMALAFAKGLVKAGVLSPGDIIASAKSEESRSRFAQAWGERPSSPCTLLSALPELSTLPDPGPECFLDDDNGEVVRRSEAVFLAVKPQVLSEVAQLLRPATRGGKLFISLAAGITLPSLRMWLGPEARVIRAMPNVPVRIGQGATVYTGGHEVNGADYELAATLLGSGGKAWRVDSEQGFDAITALSGSGPAYVYYFIAALTEAGERQGLA